MAGEDCGSCAAVCFARRPAGVDNKTAMRDPALPGLDTAVLGMLGAKEMSHNEIDSKAFRAATLRSDRTRIIVILAVLGVLAFLTVFRTLVFRWNEAGMTLVPRWCSSVQRYSTRSSCSSG